MVPSSDMDVVGLAVRPTEGIDPGLCRAVAAGGAAVLVVLLHPRIYFGAVNVALRMLGRPPLPVTLRLHNMAGLLVVLQFISGGWTGQRKDGPENLGLESPDCRPVIR